MQFEFAQQQQQQPAYGINIENGGASGIVINDRSLFLSSREARPLAKREAIYTIDHDRKVRVSEL